MGDAWERSMGKQPFALNSTDRQYPEGFLRKGQMSARQFKRATGLLELERGKRISAVSQTLGVTREPVSS